MGGGPKATFPVCKSYAIGAVIIRHAREVVKGGIKQLSLAQGLSKIFSSS